MEQDSIAPLTNEQKDAIRAKLQTLRLKTGPLVVSKYRADEFCKRCACRKHFRWSSGGTQYRRKAGTRSWVEAEEKERNWKIS